DRKNHAEAAKLSDKALEAFTDPGEDRSIVLDTSAWVAHLRHDDAKALNLIIAAIKGNDKYAPFHDHLGDILLRLGRRPAAIAAWKEALRLPAPDAGDEWDRQAVAKKLGLSPPDAQAAGG